MTEQDRIATPNESAPTSAAEVKKAKKSKPSKNATATAKKKDPHKSSSLTDDQKRLARNAALREWRRAHAHEQREYYAAWRAKQKGKQPARAESRPDRVEKAEPIAAAVPTTGSQTRVATRTKKATSKKSKKGGRV